MRHLYRGLAVGAGLIVVGALAPVWVVVSAAVLTLSVTAALWDAARSNERHPIKWEATHVHHHVYHVVDSSQPSRTVPGHIAQHRVVQGEVVQPFRKAIRG